MNTGTVKWFDNKKGYGFVTDSSNGSEVFVHHSVIGGSGYKSLNEGETVDYEFERAPKGLRATQVLRRG